MPDKPNYMEQEWVNGAADAVIALIKRRRMKQPLLIGENLGAAQVLVRAALREPSLVRGIVNIAGRPSYFKGGPKVREMVTDQQSAPFFDKVDEATWHQGNWKASQLSINPSVGDQLARDQDSPLNLTAEVTWQLEFGTIDLTEELPGLKAPLLVFDLPGLTLEQTDENNRVFYEKQYGSFDKGVAAMNAFYTSKYGSRDKARADLEKPLWADAVAACPGAKLKVEHGTGIFMTKDIPDEIDREIASFVTALSK
jgi:pimeloyl-ACP methyl ester carboxylesterase